MGKARLELLQGTLDVMVLQTLAGMGPLHGYGIARRIEQVSGNRSIEVAQPASLSSRTRQPAGHVMTVVLVG